MGRVRMESPKHYGVHPNDADTNGARVDTFMMRREWRCLRFCGGKHSPEWLGNVGEDLTRDIRGPSHAQGPRWSGAEKKGELLGGRHKSFHRFEVPKILDLGKPRKEILRHRMLGRLAF